MKTKIVGILGMALLLVCGTASAQQQAPAVSCVSGCQWSNQPTTYAQSSTIASATTTLLVSNTNTALHIYVYYMGVQSQGANSSNTVQWEVGTGNNCSGNTVTLSPAGVAPPAASPAFLGFWAGTANNSSTGPSANNVPYQAPLGDNLCGVTAGTTTSVAFITYYTLAP